MGAPGSSRPRPPVCAGGEDRRRRVQRSLACDRPRPGPAGGDQAAASRQCRGAHPVPRGGTARRRAVAREHRPDLRLRRAGSAAAAVPGDGTGGRAVAGRGAGRRPAGPRPLPGHRRADRVRPARGAPGGAGAPGHQAGQPAARPWWPREDHRLRHRAGRGLRAGHRHRPAPGDTGVPRPGAGDGSARHIGQRPVLAGHRGLRVPGGRAAVHRPRAGGGAGSPGAPASTAARPGARGRGRARPRADRQGSRGPAAQRRRGRPAGRSDGRPPGRGRDLAGGRSVRGPGRHRGGADGTVPRRGGGRRGRWAGPGCGRGAAGAGPGAGRGSARLSPWRSCLPSICMPARHRCPAAPRAGARCAGPCCPRRPRSWSSPPPS